MKVHLVSIAKIYLHKNFGVRWQAKRDTALEWTWQNNPKRRRRFALPAHSIWWRR
jgi:hypothetical protein